MTEEKEVKMGLTEEDVKHRDEGPGIGGLLQAMGDSEADTEAIAASEDGRIIAERMAVMGMPEGSEEGKEFWRGYEKGLNKEVHGEGLNKWASYVPVSAESNPDRKYPLIFCLHGANNPIQLTESYGIIQVAAREECVVIAPENENLENILSLLEYAKEHFPIDTSRVYSIGYSFGGFMTARNSLQRPEIFAGVGMGGMLFAGDVKAHELNGQPYPAYHLTEEMLETAKEVELPAALFLGENEMLRLLPLWKNPEGEVRDGVIPLQSEDKQKAFNNWRKVGGCKPAVFTAEGEGSDPVTRSIGAEFERSEVREYNGRKYFIGDSVKEDGECLFRTIACEKMVHWPSSMYAELIWEHISKFARDTKTGKLIRL